MKILIIHNKYGKFSGEEAVVETQIDLFKAQGHQVSTYLRSSEEFENLPLGKAKAFFSGIQNPIAIREVRALIQKDRPDVVHIHNLYPLISPAILPEIKKMGVPIVMTVHNYRLLCPNGLFFTQGKVCEACTGKGKEINCLTKNCEGSGFKSLGYALRNYWARTQRYYLDQVDAFLCLTNFQKEKLVKNGFSSKKCFVVPNCYTKDVVDFNPSSYDRTYVAYAGRFSKEKGIGLLLEVAKKLPEISFKLAGNHENGYLDSFQIPENVQLCGMLDQKGLKQFYEKAKFFVLTSIWYEGFPMVLPEAMAYKLPIIAPDFAGFPEIVNSQNGFLYKFGNVNHLAEIIEMLWVDQVKREKLGENGFEELQKKYTPTVYYSSINGIYDLIVKQKK